jgi:hypothetical protein
VGGYGLYLDNRLLVFCLSGLGSAFDVFDGSFGGGLVWVFWCGQFGLFVFFLIVVFFFFEILFAPGIFA